MHATIDVARSLNPRSSVRFVSILSIVALLYAALRICLIVIEAVDHLAHRGTGLVLSWNPNFPLFQPESVSYSGAPFVVPGSTAYITSMTGTIQDVPVNAIVLHSLGDLVSVVTTAGIAICILILARRVAAGTPFALASVRALVTLAIIVFIGFEGATVLHGLSAMSMPNVMFVGPDQPDGVNWPPDTTTSLFVFWPVYVAAALVALAAVFRDGARSQSDSSGLI